MMADRTANNRVDLFVRGGTVQLSAEGAYGRSQEALSVSQEGSESEIALAYNADYLLSALRPVARRRALFVFRTDESERTGRPARPELSGDGGAAADRLDVGLTFQAAHAVTRQAG